MQQRIVYLIRNSFRYAARRAPATSMAISRFRRGPTACGQAPPYI